MKLDRSTRRTAVWLVIAATGLAACDGSVTTPDSNEPAALPDQALVDYDILEDPSNVTVEAGFFKICKVGPVGTVATFDVEEYRWRAIRQAYDTTRAVVQVEAGKCKLISQNEPDPWVRVTERTAPGMVLDSIRLTYDREVKEGLGGPYHHDPTSGTYVITDSSTVLAAIGQAGTPDDADGEPFPRYRRAGAAAIFFNSPAEFGKCEGGVSKLVLKYIGAAPLTEAVRGKRRNPGPSAILDALETTVGGTTYYTFAIAGLGGQFSPVANGRLANNFQIFIGNTMVADIHTSCSAPIFPGMQIAGLFEIVEVYSLKGGAIPPPP
jgi:hypothetical protein